VQKFATGRDRLLYRPIFLRNLCDFWAMCGGAEDRLAVLFIFAPLALRWMDATRIVGNRDAERSATVLRRILRLYAKWDELVGDAGSLQNIVQLDKRLKGVK